jgi:hypothetical protein
MSADHHSYRIKYLKKQVIAQGEFTIMAKRQDQPLSASPEKTP